MIFFGEVLRLALDAEMFQIYGSKVEGPIENVRQYLKGM